MAKHGHLPPKTGNIVRQSPGITRDIDAQAAGVIPTRPGAKNKLPDAVKRSNAVRGVKRRESHNSAGRVPGLRKIHQ